ncbi:MAG TPA: tetratricopeptide repeat protein [Moraxellaceae bacterium]|nr:tetratricopeptide repeat protein [Moraxellaceae bacterium]
MSTFLLRRKATVALSLGLLVAACSTAPQRPTVDTTNVPDSNEPDLVAQLRERMASGQLKTKAKTEQTGTTSATADTSSAPKVSIDPVKQQAAMAIAPDYARAVGLMRAGNDAEALALFQNLSTRAPQFAGPLLNQGVILLHQEKYPEAEAALRAALKTSPNSPYANNLLGIALRQQGKFPEAKAAYEAALTADPGYARAHFNLGVLLDLYMQDLPQALTHYERYQSLQAKPDPAVANWIVDLQKRTGVYKAPPKPAPAPTPVNDGGSDATGSDSAPAAAATAPAPANGAAPAAPAAAPTGPSSATTAPAAPASAPATPSSSPADQGKTAA